MKSRLSVGVTAAAILAGCWSFGVFAEPVLQPEPPQEVELKLLEAQRPDEPVAEADEAAVAASPVSAKAKSKVSQQPSGLGPGQLKVALVGLWLRGMAVAASAAPAPIPSGVNPFPDQPRLDVSWSLQGLADEEDQGGEGDIVDYDG